MTLMLVRGCISVSDKQVFKVEIHLADILQHHFYNRKATHHIGVSCCILHRFSIQCLPLQRAQVYSPCHTAQISHIWQTLTIRDAGLIRLTNTFWVV